MPEDGEGAGEGAVIGGGAVGRGVVPSGTLDRVGVLATGGSTEGKEGVTCWQAVSKMKRESRGNRLDRYSRITVHLLADHFN